MWNTVLLVPSGLHWSHRNWRPGEVNFGTERPRQGMNNDEKTTSRWRSVGELIQRPWKMGDVLQCILGLPITDGDFPVRKLLVYQMVSAVI